MKFVELPLQGAWEIAIDAFEDDRGFFARLYCEEEFLAKGLVNRYAQTSLSYNRQKGTVRGLHFQLPPYEETKCVRCVAGSILDVLVDLRRGSPTYLQTFSLELSARQRNAVYIPAGFAHGFQVLENASEVLYMIDIPYQSSAASGMRWDDPAITVKWPLPISLISAKDTQFADWQR
jgi:dTDP-4-dehydrorhamnose 3,5-epimerase